MGVLQRQNSLFVSEDWVRIYEAIQNVEFRAYDFDNYVAALLDHLRDVFPEEFNDWIASSEFIMKVEVLAWLSQNISFRIDLNARENFLATAERRDSLIRLAQNVSYKVSRVRGAAGRVRVESIRTNQSLFDSNNIDLQDREIRWNDPRNEDFFEQFIIVMNGALTSRTQFGRPLTKVVSGQTRAEQYVFNGQSPSTGSYPFTATVNGVGLPFDIINARIDKDNGRPEEFPPNPNNAQNVLYISDGFGLSSDGTGFFFEVRQGAMKFQEEEFTDAIVSRTVIIDTQNVNNDDFFIEQLDALGDVVEVWEKVDTAFGESVSFLPTDRTGFLDEGADTTGNQASGNARNVYELDTLENDRVRVKFGDGSFGAIPLGRYRFWYRTSNPQPQLITSSDIGEQSFTVPYVSNGTIYFLTVTVGLKTDINNASASETNFSIRTRANQVYYAQNRMVTGRDYNSFFLRDNAISKVKTVNRTFAGHSRFTKLHDPTGLYENVKIFASDGRFFQERITGVNFADADETVLPPALLIQNQIEPQLEEANKQQLYYNDYPELFFPTNHFWLEDSVVSQQSRGRVVTTVGNAGTAIAVGDATISEPAKFIQVDSVFRLDSPRGSTVRVDRITDDGDIVDGVTLERDIDAGIRIVSVFPPFRTKLTESEKVLIEQQIELKFDFGLTWNQTAQTWDIILADNLDKQESGGNFCLDNQGSTSGTNLDQSWMVYLEFVPNATSSGDQWKIVDRGLGVFFESARENDFFFASNEAVVDPETGSVKFDSIIINECNESRDSLRRRGITNIAAASLLECDIFCYQLFGDGIITDFATSENPLSPNAVVTVNDVLQINSIDYNIITKVSGDIVRFFVPPVDGAEVMVCVSLTDILKSQITDVFIDVQGDGIDNIFDLGTTGPSRAENFFVFMDGVYQRPLVDYSLTTLGGGNLGIFLQQPLAIGVNMFVYGVSGITDSLFDRLDFTGDGATVDITIATPSQTLDTVWIWLDGIMQAKSVYSVVSDTNDTTITFVTAPSNGAVISISAQNGPTRIRSSEYDFGVSDGVTSNFTLSNDTSVTAPSTMVFVDGIAQAGSPWAVVSTPSWSAPGGNNITFFVPPIASTVVTMISWLGSVGTDSPQGQSGLSFGGGTTGLALGQSNLGNTSVQSLLVSYIGTNIPLFVENTIKTPDGYVNSNGLEVRPADFDNSGFVDNPFIFKDLVLQDGFTDLVLWRKVEEFGFTVDEPISITTRPRGTYGLAAQGDVAVSDTIDNGSFLSGIPGQVLNSLAQTQYTVLEGDIHYDTTTAIWLIADVITTNTWIAAPDQTLFKWVIGRDNLKFQWLHFAPDSFRIDPSVSNVMDTYLLTSSYDTAFRTALSNNTPTVDLPAPPTSESLRIDFADFDDFKTTSDSLIYHSARYKILFGPQADAELRATFKVIQSEGSLLSENDLRLRILEIINVYFSVDNWNFGETFYMTELLAFIHQEMAPNIQTVVAVPNLDTEAFGRLFQVRSEPDQLLISAASVDDIQVVRSFTDEELRIGVIS
jgi:hypothetical protein